jgi:signal transduction histidine kinase
VPRRRSLRLRLTLAFGFSAAFLSVLFAALAYVGVRHILVTDRQSTDLRQAYVNAALVRSAVGAGTPAMGQLVASLDAATSATSLVELRGAWYAAHVSLTRAELPAALMRAAGRDEVARQVLVSAGTPVLFIDVPVPAAHAVYYQLDDLGDLNRTLRTLLLLLAAGALFTTVVGAVGGGWITRRAMAPLEVASLAAERVAGGALDTRIPEDARDREVAALATSFNTMVEQLVERLRRDARFAGDVSHELRSPLTTLATSVEVMRQSREQLSPEGRAAFDLLATDVGTFQVLVEDLLEIARSDAGASMMHLEPVDFVELVHQCVRSAQRRHQLAAVPVVVEAGLDAARVRVDRRRFERVMTNLLDNAARYGGGATAIRLSRAGDDVVVDVDDAGPGVDPRDAHRVFDRFFRGTVAHDRGAARGTGLGLALVADHVAHFGGHVELLASPEGGARFRISLPALEEDR